MKQIAANLTIMLLLLTPASVIHAISTTYVPKVKMEIAYYPAHWGKPTHTTVYVKESKTCAYWKHGRERMKHCSMGQHVDYQPWNKS